MDITTMNFEQIRQYNELGPGGYQIAIDPINGHRYCYEMTPQQQLARQQAQAA